MTSWSWTTPVPTRRKCNVASPGTAAQTYLALLLLSYSGQQAIKTKPVPAAVDLLKPSWLSACRHRQVCSCLFGASWPVHEKLPKACRDVLVGAPLQVLFLDCCTHAQATRKGRRPSLYGCSLQVGQLCRASPVCNSLRARVLFTMLKCPSRPQVLTQVTQPTRVIPNARPCPILVVTAHVFHSKPCDI